MRIFTVVAAVAVAVVAGAGQSAFAQSRVEIPGLERVKACWDRGDGVLTGAERLMDTAPSRDTDWAMPRGGASVVTLLDNGPVDKRVDLVFVGDGYTAEEMDLYHQRVDHFVTTLFLTEPFKSYKSRFNVHRVDVVSNESGVDHDPTLGVLRDTAMDMGFWCQGNSDIERSLCVDSLKARSFSALAPDDDQVIALANSNKFGGAAFFGTLISCVSADAFQARFTLQHELGHSMFTLEDEYDTGGPAQYTGPEFGRANISIYDAQEQLDLETKWHYMMGDSIAGFDGPIGAFEGARYSRFGIFRSSLNSKMRSSARPFNLVGIEGGLRAIHNAAGGFSQFDDATQPLFGAFSGHDHEFFVEPIHPSSHELTIWWQLGTEIIPGKTDPRLHLCELQLQPGEYTLIVKLQDDTPWIRDEFVRQQTVFSNGVWFLTIETQPADRTADGNIDFDDILDFVVDYAGADPTADLAEPFGELDVTDVLEYLDRFTTPCG